MKLKNKLKNIFVKEGFSGVIKRLYFYFLTSKEIRIIQHNKATRKYILRLNDGLLSKVDSKSVFKESNNSDIIWFFWLQGIERAPRLVQMCLYRLKELYPDKRVIVIDKNNLDKYVKFPSFILEKKKLNQISNTHFSDLLRLELLIKYGGTWIDSTVFCSSKADDLIFFNVPMFFLTADLRNDKSIGGSSWFLTSAPNNPVLILTRDLLYKYWNNNNKLDNYFLFHICFEISLEKYPLIRKNIPPVSNVPSHLLAEIINDDFNNLNYKVLIENSSFHKLSNKKNLQFDGHNNTYLTHIMDSIGFNDENN
ncbi:capsular polysaccharide synthesis protein [Pediococcus pentosaceus]|uniref:capsular polysaccharide synthesis protein n=1 Tax=Pediococcus pentosaceus TaxID=1255 RepID=UPI0018FE6520|nr:capsular polysaccharide synthesis protein [Pediococcus pentosaceus]MBF7136441.1 capsular polysaccharide synthesis protein [Pediococcus pentosaceus]